MIGYKLRRLKQAFDLLQCVIDDNENLDDLANLQKVLLAEIMNAEGKIKFYKAELQEEARLPPRRVKWLNTRIESLRYLNWIWRCFGDAIAFTYSDKHALKHVYYDTESVNAKQDAGFFTGRSGLANEIGVLTQLIERGIPAILSDLTNTIRHGDVTALVGPDPFPIEVKTTKKLNPRGKRQVRDLRRIQSFYDTDVSNSFRGMGPVIRVEASTPEVSYVAELNECIERAIEHGYGVVRPEDGLAYVAIYRDDANLVELLPSDFSKNTWFFYLNTHKSSRIWEPYTPFVLSIRSFDNLVRFIRGQLGLIVVVDLDVICTRATQLGIQTSVTDLNGPYPLAFWYGDEPIPGRISAHFLSRIAFEFVSPRWVADYIAAKPQPTQAQIDLAGPPHEDDTKVGDE